MIERINNNPVANLAEKTASYMSNIPKTITDNGVPVTLQAEYADLIDKAAQATSDDINAVEQAKKLLLSGKLESPENIQSAAENIIKFGI